MAEIILTPQLNNKFCARCQIDTERNKFGRCKPCKSTNNTVWRIKNLESSRAATARYRAANPEKVKQSVAKWAAANPVNPDKVKALAAARYAADPERHKARNRVKNRAYWAANREKLCVVQQNKRAQKRADGGRLSPGLSAKLFTLQKGKCPCCHQPLGDDYHLDHIVPTALGGANTDDNMQLLRAQCNLQKSATHPVKFMQSRGFLL